MAFLTIAEAAKELGRSVSWLRDAEKKGKLPKARRDLNGWRVYTEEDLQRLRQLLVPDGEEHAKVQPKTEGA